VEGRRGERRDAEGRFVARWKADAVEGGTAWRSRLGQGGWEEMRRGARAGAVGGLIAGDGMRKGRKWYGKPANLSGLCPPQSSSMRMRSGHVDSVDFGIADCQMPCHALLARSFIHDTCDESACGCCRTV
jgi:hypothetical protein